MDEQVEQQRAPRRVVDSYPRDDGMPVPLGTQIVVVLGAVLLIAIMVIIVMFGGKMWPYIVSLFQFFGAYAWFWTLLFFIVLVGAVLGLLRRFGAIAFVEDLVLLGLKIHKHFVDADRLHADKLGNYDIPLIKGEAVEVYPGNPAYAPQMALPAGAGSRRRNAAANNNIVVTPESAQLAGPGSLLQLNAPNVQPATSEVHNAQTVRLDDWGDDWLGGDGTGHYVRKVVPGQYNFLEELDLYTPTVDGVFMGRGADGPVLLSIKDAWHITFAGPTGVGKSKIVRMVFAQLIGLNMQCYLCDPHYAPVDVDEGLDWTPIESRLACPPLRTSDETADFLEWLDRGELEERKKRKYYQKPIGSPIFVALEELAALADDRPDAGKHIGSLLRQARKYRICVAMAAQGLLVKSVGLDSDMLNNIRTGYYGGGDWRTAKIALNLGNGESVNDEGIGGGLVYLRTVVHKATLVRVPWPDNDAITRLCEMSTLPVRELVREPMAEGIIDSVYRPGSKEQGPVVVHPVEPGRLGREQEPLKPELVEKAKELHLGNKRLGLALGITEYMAGRYNVAAGWRTKDDVVND
jgi:hypothetical protein